MFWQVRSWKQITNLAVLIVSLTRLIRVYFAFRGQKLANVGYRKNNLFHCTIATNNLKQKQGEISLKNDEKSLS